jgi:serine/threonine protein kinase
LLYNLLQDRTDNLMVMEYINGLTLDKLVKKQGKLPVELAERIVMQALDGLYHAHQKGILHRDIKPANLMLTQEGVVKLMDFGIARLVGSQRLTRADRVVGTLEYMAPELLDRVEPPVQSDLYAVGVLLYELLSEKMPFEATTDSTLINQILNKAPISLRSRMVELPKLLEAVLEKLFAHYDAHKFNFREDWDKYRLSALGGGVKVNFGGTLQALRPFVEVGVVNQRLVIDPVLFNGRLFEYLLRGLAVQANGGVQYFVSPQLALRGNVGFSAGKFSSFQLNRDGIEDRPDVKTFRVGVGVSYFFN